MERKSKIRFVLFCLFLLFICCIGNGYINISKETDGGYAVLYAAWFLGTFIREFAATFIFKLVSLRKFDIVSGQEFRLSVVAAIVATTAFMIYGVVMTHQVLFPLWVNAGRLAAILSAYVLSLHLHSQEKIRKRLLKN